MTRGQKVILSLLGILIALLIAAAMEGQERMPIVRVRQRSFPACGPELADGTPCLWKKLGDLSYPVALGPDSGRGALVTGTIYLTLPAGYGFRHLDWQMLLEAANGSACPDVPGNNVVFEGFARYFIECAP